MSDGWAKSAQAWIDNNGEDGDDSRRFILDPVMRQRLPWFHVMEWRKSL